MVYRGGVTGTKGFAQQLAPGSGALSVPYNINYSLVHVAYSDHRILVVVVLATADFECALEPAIVFSPVILRTTKIYCRAWGSLVH